MKSYYDKTMARWIKVNLKKVPSKLSKEFQGKQGFQELLEKLMKILLLS